MHKLRVLGSAKYEHNSQIQGNFELSELEKRKTYYLLTRDSHQIYLSKHTTEELQKIDVEETCFVVPEDFLNDFFVKNPDLAKNINWHHWKSSVKTSFAIGVGDFIWPFFSELLSNKTAAMDPALAAGGGFAAAAAGIIPIICVLYYFSHLDIIKQTPGLSDKEKKKRIKDLKFDIYMLAIKLAFCMGGYPLGYYVAGLVIADLVLEGGAATAAFAVGTFVCTFAGLFIAACLTDMLRTFRDPNSGTFQWHKLLSLQEWGKAFSAINWRKNAEMSLAAAVAAVSCTLCSTLLTPIISSAMEHLARPIITFVTSSLVPALVNGFVAFCAFLVALRPERPQRMLPTKENLSPKKNTKVKVFKVDGQVPTTSEISNPNVAPTPFSELKECAPVPSFFQQLKSALPLPTCFTNPLGVPS